MLTELRFTSLLGGVATVLPRLPRTASEAKRFAVEQNARARQDRAARERTHAAELAEQDRVLAEMKAAAPIRRAPAARSRGPKFNVTKLYRQRNGGRA